MKCRSRSDRHVSENRQIRQGQVRSESRPNGFVVQVALAGSAGVKTVSIDEPLTATCSEL